ncbi:MAG: hypothetical protein AAFO29_18690 [Actinomycetota bacterium]
MTTSSDDLLGRAGSASEVAELRRQLRAERERALNARDQMLGAQAEAAQTRAQIKELEYVLHVREAELATLKAQLERIPTGGSSPLVRGLRTLADQGPPAVRRAGQRLRAARR